MAPRARHHAKLLYAALLLAVTPAFAQQGGQRDDHAAAAQADASAGAAGQKAAVDPQTGRLRPITPEEARELVAGLTASLSQSDQGLTAVRLPNGALVLDLQGRFESAMLARIGADGKVDAECVTSVDEAKHFLGVSADVPAASGASDAPASALEER
jgi:hypothetical protein